MASDTADVQGELEQLRRRFEEFRNTQSVRSRLPESLWAAAAELARRHGVNPTARALRLDYTGLRKRVEKQDQPKQKPKVATAPTFMESVAPGAKAVTNCTVEVESVQGGKLGPGTDRVAQSHRITWLSVAPQAQYGYEQIPYE